MSNLLHTFRRYAAISLRWAVGERAHRLTSAVAALPADALAEGARSAMRFTIPLYDTPTDALPHLLRRFGLPPYIESYAATMGRLRDSWATLAIAGSRAMLESEAELCGLEAPIVAAAEPPGLAGDAGSKGFAIFTDSAGGDAHYGEDLIWGQFQFGHQLPPNAAKNLRAMLRHYRPARELYVGAFPSYSWTAGEPLVDGTLAIPDWMTYECETAETSIQVGPSEVVTGFPAHAPRAVSRDGVTFGLAVEKGATNPIDEQILNNWTPINGPHLNSVETPAGAIEDAEIEDDSATLVEYYRRNIAVSAGATYSASLWSYNAASIAERARAQILDGSLTTFAFIDQSESAAWARLSISGVAVTGGTGQIRLVPRILAVSQTGVAGFWGLQLEAGGYATSFIGADNATFTRAVGKLSVPIAAVAPGRFFRFDLRWASPYAAGALALVDHSIVYVSEDYRLFFRAADRRFVLLVGAKEIVSSVADFAQFSEVSARVRHSLSGIELTLAGAGSASGTYSSAGEPAMPVATAAYLFGNESGAEESAELRGINDAN